MPYWRAESKQEAIKGGEGAYAGERKGRSVMKPQGTQCDKATRDAV